MADERRFQLGSKLADTDEPGLVLNDDGTVSLVAPDGTRSDLGAGGGGPFNGGEITNGLVVDATNTPNGYAEDVLSGGLMVEDLIDVWENADGTGATVRLRPALIDLATIAPAIELKDANGSPRLTFSNLTGLMTYNESGDIMIRVDPTGVTYLGVNLVSAVLAGGAFVTGQNAAPADGDLGAGQCAIWFDKTNGAAKLKFKGKSANGSVVVGEVALT